MNLTNQRRLAASLLDIGVNRVWIDPEKISDIEGAITRTEIRKLIQEGAIKALPEHGTSRGRARVLAQKKRSGRRIGMGTKKGKAFAKVSEKTRWMNRIRGPGVRYRSFPSLVMAMDIFSLEWGKKSYSPILLGYI